MECSFASVFNCHQYDFKHCAITEKNAKRGRDVTIREEEEEEEYHE